MDQLKKDASYCVGMSVGQSLENQDLENISLDAFMEGISDVFAKRDLKFTPQQANGIIQEYLDKNSASKFDQYKTEGAEFLAQNAKRAEVVTLPSGLQYEIMQAGTGVKPGVDSEVTVHYHGTLTSGTVFDSSVLRGQPASFGVTQVIKGWTEALQLMSEGSKWKLFIPEHLAYGAHPRPGGPIKPYMALIFEVELLAVN